MMATQLRSTCNFKESSTIEGNTKLRNINENVQYKKQIQISKTTSKKNRLVQFVY